VTQPLHSMQRSESQMNFILAIFFSNQWGPSSVASQLLVRPQVRYTARSMLQIVVLVSCIMVTLS